eukprot:5152252-Lingulodinium_polyedra.AAC.1
MEPAVEVEVPEGSKRLFAFDALQAKMAKIAAMDAADISMAVIREPGLFVSMFGTDEQRKL